MKKQIPTTIGLLIISFAAIVAGTSIVLVNQEIGEIGGDFSFERKSLKEIDKNEDDFQEQEDEKDSNKEEKEKKSEEEEGEKNEESKKEEKEKDEKEGYYIVDEAENVLLDFLEYMYITGEYEKAAEIYLGFKETDHNNNLRPTEDDKREQLEWTARTIGFDSPGYDVEKVEIKDTTEVSKEEFRFEFSLIRENGEAVRFGPCCGDFETPEWYTHPYFVKKVEGDYRVHGELLYLP